MKSNIIKTHKSEEGIEAHLVETERGFFIGAYDLDAKEYYPGAKIYPHTLENAYEKAAGYFEDFITPYKICIPV